MRKRLLVLFVLAAVVLGVVASVVRAQVEDWPLANAGSNYTVFEGEWLMVDAGGSHGMYDQEPNRYTWDLDHDGAYETDGFSVWFDASGRDGSASQVVGLEVCYEMACDADAATIDILNVPPQVDAGSNATIYSGQTFTVNSIFTDPGVNDTHTAMINLDNAAGTVAGSIFESGGSGIVTATGHYSILRVRNISVCVNDDDGGTTCDTLTLNVVPVPVSIDIKPYYSTNTVNPQSESTLKVAILGSATLDADDINPDTVTLAGAVALYWSPYYEDVNYDGRDDLVVRVNPPEMVISKTAVQATLTAQLYNGDSLQGTDMIDLVPPPAPTMWTSVYPTFDWNPVNGGICYQIQLDNDADFSSVEQLSTIVEGTQYNAFPLYSGSYYWRVRVGGLCINVIQSGWSATRTFTVP